MSRRLFSMLAVVGALAFAQPAQAGPLLNGTFGYVPLGGATTYTGASLGAATTSVTLPSNEIINTLPPTFLGNPNDFAAGGAAPLALSQTVVLNPLTISTLGLVNTGLQVVNLPQYLTFSSGTSPANRFQFSATSIMVTSSGTGNLAIGLLGTIHDVANVFSDNSASVSYSFTQTVPGSAVNGSATFATPQDVLVSPEPSTLGLAGLAVVAGLAAVRRRRTV